MDGGLGRVELLKCFSNLELEVGLTQFQLDICSMDQVHKISGGLDSIQCLDYQRLIVSSHFCIRFHRGKNLLDYCCKAGYGSGIENVYDTWILMVGSGVQLL